MLAFRHFQASFARTTGVVTRRISLVKEMAQISWTDDKQRLRGITTYRKTRPPIQRRSTRHARPVSSTILRFLLHLTIRLTKPYRIEQKLFAVQHYLEIGSIVRVKVWPELALAHILRDTRLTERKENDFAHDVVCVLFTHSDHQAYAVTGVVVAHKVT